MIDDDSSPLERAVAEIQVLHAIYGEDLLTIRSHAEWNQALECIQHTPDPPVAVTVPQLQLQIELTTIHIIETLPVPLRLRFTLPPGYPEHSAAEVYVESTTTGLNKSVLDDVSIQLRSKAQECLGHECLMDLVHELQDLVDRQQLALTLVSSSLSSRQKQPETDLLADATTTTDLITSHKLLGRRWIWVHHITNTERCKSIVREARALNLGGYLKPGYPGIVVVEGAQAACDEFVTWIKGNKSRPGGFGRNWGHHVRGEIQFEMDSDCKLPRRLFVELGDSMKELGALCDEHGLHEEFREFVLQHKQVDPSTGSISS